MFGNSVMIVQFAEPAEELHVESAFRAEHYPLAETAVEIEPYAQRYPFSYDASEVPDLGRTLERHYADPEHKVDLWARGFFEKTDDTLTILTNMTKAIQADFTYNARDEMGTQDPVTTLTSASGTCRDYTLLMMEAARSLGLAARFVSGYLYDESKIDGAADTVIGGGATHAWALIYLPGAGWVPFDPTNGLVSDRNLIRVATVRDPSQAIPLSGSFTGKPTDFLGMEVSLEITAGRRQATEWAQVATMVLSCSLFQSMIHAFLGPRPQPIMPSLVREHDSRLPACGLRRSCSAI